MKVTRVVLTLSLLVVPTLLAQTDTKDKCRLEGHVVNSVTGLPVRKAAVTLRDVSGIEAATPSKHPPQGKSEREDPAVTTDAEGHFVFEGLAPGSYGLETEHAGFRSQNSGIPWLSGSGEPVKLVAGDSRTGIVIKLLPLGVITGRVVDEDGDPIRQVNVSAQVSVATPNGRRLEPRGESETNDLGEYRIFDLEPRKYYLKAEPHDSMGFGIGARGKRADSFLAEFFPGSPEESGAQELDLAPGRPLQGVDFTLRKGHLATLRGRVVAPEGAANISVTWGHRTEGLSTTTSFGARADGSFQVPGVTPGIYSLGATCVVEGKQYDVYTPVNVGASDINDIELHPMRPVNVTGRVRIEGTNGAKLTGIVVDLAAKVGFSRASGNVRSDGSFTVQGTPRDVYEVNLGNISGMFVKSVRAGDTDISKSGLDLTNASSDAELSIVLSSNPATVEGRILNENGEPAGYARVALIPKDAGPDSSAIRRIGTRTGDRADVSGHFAFKDLAPGSYRVYAWQQTDDDYGEVSPEFFRLNESRSVSLDVAEGERKTVQVTLIPRERDDRQP